MKRATQDFGKLVDNFVISIHALVKRATSVSFCDNFIHVISIHALVKRATNNRYTSNIL